MGHPLRQHDTSFQNTSAALSALPSPASVTGPLDTPTLCYDLNSRRLYPGPFSPCDAALDGIIPSEPATAESHPIMTPPINDRPEQSLNMIVGGALAPVPSSAPPLSSAKASRPGLSLPSFEQLGIAAPHPDRIRSVSSDGRLTDATRDVVTVITNGPHSDSEIVHAFGEKSVERGREDDIAPAKAPGRAILSPVHHYVDVLTPPADSGDTQWNLRAAVQAAAMDSPATDPGAPTFVADEEATPTGLPSGLPSQIPTLQASDHDHPASWIDGAVDQILANIQSAPLPMESLRILSHALPSPSATGHMFSHVINSIQGPAPVSPTSPMTWINVFHAVPGRFNLADLPTSPPSTPGPAVAGEDYFTQKVFDSAVSITDYQGDTSALPRSPRPIVPPSSIDVSIVERYIPPSSSNEFAQMFDSHGPSILGDRLVELSPNNGSLLFIYPTQKGAQTFMREYLGPILDPALRSMGVMYGMGSELSISVGSMAAVDQLPDHESLQHRIGMLCARLTQRASSAHRSRGHLPNFSISYSSKQYVRLSRDTWARDWWTKQEKQRIREAVTRHAQRNMHSPGLDRQPSATELVQQLLNDVCKKPYPSAQEPTSGIEVSVFVIRRSA